MNATRNSSTSVLIVGAGPTGLMMAAQLERFRIPYSLIEKNSGPTTQSRALVIQARSLELFAQMGIAQRAVQEGRQAKAVNYVANGKLAQRISLEGHGEDLTAFPFLLILDQSRTERLLIDYLKQYGHAVEWETELLSFSENGNRIIANLKHADGSTETLHADWLVGTDGAKSVVRQQLGIPFGGKTYEHSLFVLDCKVDLPFKEDEGYVAFSDSSFAAFFPMTEGRCRVISILSEEQSKKEDISFEDVASDFAKRMQMDVKLSDPKWISVYHSHHRYVSRFQKGHCFLAGDAAHIHSPVGAQGMNTGLQDAYNLAWKLAMVISGKAKQNLLETYNQERIAVARNLVRTTDRVFSLTLNTSPIARFWIMRIAPYILDLVLKEKHLARFAFNTVSQIGIHYPQNSLATGASVGAFPRSAPSPGERLPYLEYEQDGKIRNIHDKVTAPTFTLLLFPATLCVAGVEAIRNVAQTFDSSISLEMIPMSSETEPLYQALGVEHGGFYVVRPDMHIAYRSSSFNAEAFEQYLKHFLIQSDSTSY